MAEGDRRSTKAKAEDQVNILISEVTVESSYLRTKRSKLRSPGRVQASIYTRPEAI